MKLNNSKVSIKDVAKHAGVGLGTVSRAINNSGSISEETKRKVLESIRELGYTPNRIAQSMRSNKYKNIVFFVDFNNITFSRIANGIFKQLENKGYMLSLCDIGNNPLEKIKSFISGHQFDGIILAPPREDDEELNEYLRSLTIPIVTLEQTISGIANGADINYYDPVNQATTYLLSLGHEKIGLLCGSTHIRSNRKIIKGYEDALEKHYLPINENRIVSGDFTQEAMEKVVNMIKTQEITAIICMHTKLVHGLFKSMKSHGLWYPEDVSIITVEDYELTELLNPSLTVIKRSLVEIGSKMSEMLIRYIENPEMYGKITPFNVQTEFIIRESCIPVLKKISRSR